jgi:hypothetical protein
VDVPVRAISTADIGFDQLLDQSCAASIDTVDYLELARESVDCLITLWRQWTGCGPRPTDSVRNELAAHLGADGDLTPLQVEVMLARLSPATSLPLHDWLLDCSERLLLRTRPWFPLWWSYTRWLLAWCQDRGYQQLVFLARDSLPLYAAARAAPAAIRDGLDLHLLDAPRSLMDSPLLGRHVAAITDWAKPLVVVDTGCYGTMVSWLAEFAARAGHGDHVAAAFFVSRNPRIFGYLNYLMGWRYLDDPSDRGARRSPMDFVIYACDILESLPKPYQVAAHESGVSQVPTDLASFALSLRLYAEVTRYVTRTPELGVLEAAYAADQLYRGFTHAGEPAGASVALLDSVAPKNPPPAAVLERIGVTSLAPQNEVFGTLAG